jgi:hypothetical protein
MCHDSLYGTPSKCGRKDAATSRRDYTFRREIGLESVTNERTADSNNTKDNLNLV